MHLHTSMHTCTHTHTHTHTQQQKNTPQKTHTHQTGQYAWLWKKPSLEIVIEQVCLEGSLKRGGRIGVVECLRQTVPNWWASIRNCSKLMGQHKKTTFHQMFSCLHKGWQRFRCWMWIVIVLMEHKVEGDWTGSSHDKEMFKRWNWSRLCVVY